MITRFRLKIIETGLNQYQVAGLVGISPAKIAEYCLGERDIPQYNLDKLAVFFECEPEELVGIIDSPLYTDLHLDNKLAGRSVGDHGDNP